VQHYLDLEIAAGGKPRKLTKSERYTRQQCLLYHLIWWRGVVTETNEVLISSQLERGIKSGSARQSDQPGVSAVPLSGKVAR
jgi:hypothetical protein